MLPDWNYVRQVQGERVLLANAYLDMANRSRAARDYAQAQQLYQKVVGILPHDKVVWTCLGECWTNLAKYPRAHACYKQALACDPAFVPALLGLADCATLAKRPRQALKLLKRAEALLDDDAAMQCQLQVARGNAYFALREHAKAERAYRRAMKLRPDYYPPYGNLGNILGARGEFQEARQLYAKAYTMGKDPVMGMNLGILALLLGDYEEGWKWYGTRVEDPRHLEFQRFAGRPVWRGEPVENLYICGEQGLGDLAHFMRYLPLARQRARRLVLEVTRGWEKFAELFGCADEVVARRDGMAPAAEFDAWVPLLSLPPVLDLPQPCQAPKPPYLKVEGHAPPERPAIALFWRGNPEHPCDRDRSIPLETLAPLVRSQPKAHWFTLHPEEEAAEDIRRAGLPIERISGFLTEATRWLAGADLVIGVDTAPLHIAGALGLPAWFLLAPNPDWRWGVEGERTPWYPEVRLFRSRTPREWTGTVAQVKEALGRL
ncbi:MAG TPA: tetratricopeptide repeat protein [Gammaproteobacteria bacterium]|jgi:tetratricopeptide (TPR) repeat protein|nr:tetratricopeptide repeat protein [Gammaproteobacteria bacterium]